MAKRGNWWEGPAYVLHSGEPADMPLSPEVVAAWSDIGAAFIEAYGKPSPFADGLSQLNPDGPSSLSDRGETVLEFLERFGQPDA